MGCTASNIVHHVDDEPMPPSMEKCRQQKRRRQGGCRGDIGSVINDSIHTMVERDRRVAQRHGLQHELGYKPREPHPLLRQLSQEESNHKQIDVRPAVTATEDDTVLILLDENDSSSSLCSQDVGLRDVCHTPCPPKCYGALTTIVSSQFRQAAQA